MEDIFLSCVLSPFVDADATAQLGYDATATKSDTGAAGKSRLSRLLLPTVSPHEHKITAFYEDNVSERFVVSVPFALRFPTPDACAAFLRAGCAGTTLASDKNEDDAIVKEEVDPADANTETQVPSLGTPASADARWTLGVEAKVSLTFGTGRAVAATVEDVTIARLQRIEATITPGPHSPSSSVVVRIDTEITVRVMGGADFAVDEAARVKTLLEVHAVLLERLSPPNVQVPGSAIGPGCDESRNSQQQLITRSALAILDRVSGEGSGSSFGNPPLVAPVLTVYGHHRPLRLISPPVTLQVALTYALTVNVRSSVLAGTDTNTPAGRTLVMVTIGHSNTHSDPVVVDHLAIHPQQSVLVPVKSTAHTTSPSSRQPDKRVQDMSQLLRWSLESGSTSPTLPFTLHPHESYALLLVLDASDDVAKRTFQSPLAITATVETPTTLPDHAHLLPLHPSIRHRTPARRIVATTLVEWTSAHRQVLDVADTFRVSMRLVSNPDAALLVSTDNTTISSVRMTVEDEDADPAWLPGTYRIGEPFGLQILMENMSLVARDVQVQVLDESQNHPTTLSVSSTALADGQELTVGGLRHANRSSSVRKDSVKYHHGWTKPQSLVTVDQTTNVGWIPPRHHSSQSMVSSPNGGPTRAILRFVPLQAGPLRIPPLQLVDRGTGLSYSCAHNMVVVVTSS